MEGAFDITVMFPPAMLNRKKKESILCLTNNISLWWKHSKTRIKNEFKDILKQWYLPEWQDNPYERAEIHFTVLRANGKKLDADSMAPSTFKWSMDTLVEQGYLVDDDKVKLVLHPTRLNQKNQNETMVLMQVKLEEQYKMTVNELREKIEQLKEDLESVGGEKHVKAASARVRKILGEIKNATPGLRRELVDMDKR